MAINKEADFIMKDGRAIYPPVISDESLKLWYDTKGKKNSDRHKDKMFDMSGNKNHGTLENFDYKNLSGYQEDSELVFDGINDTLKMPELSGIDSNNFTYQLNNNILAFTGSEVKTVKNGDIQVGGRNLALGDSPIDPDKNYFVTNGGRPVKFDPNYEGFYTEVHRGRRFENLSAGSYTISLEARRRDSGISIYTILTTNMGARLMIPRSDLTDNWQVFKQTFEVKKGEENLKRELAFYDRLFWRNIKLEKGTKATDWTPAPEDLLETTELKGNILGDIEDIIDDHTRDEQSGLEVFTDKADDSLVRVEVDGKSYQHAGSGKNLFDIRMIDRSLSSNGNTIGAQLILKPNTTYTLSTNALTGGTTKDVFFAINLEGASSGANGVDGNGIRTIVTDESGAVIVWVRGSTISAQKWILSDFIEGDRWIQLEEGSTATEYEPPVPTPDYPIEIHSLNDFDVVSQKSEGGKIDGIEVGGRNYHRGGIYLPRNVTANSDMEKTPLKKGTYTFSFQEVRNMTKWRMRFILFKDGIVQENTLDKITVNGWERVYSAGNNIYMSNNDTNELVAEVILHDDYEVLWGFSGGDSTPDSEMLYPQIEKGTIATDWTPAPEDNPYDTLENNLYKTNILLSEPLRSVGDVKDRLFRDEDGKWKVERNVGETVADESASFTDGNSNAGYIHLPKRGNTESNPYAKHSHAIFKGNVLLNLRAGNYSISISKNKYAMGYPEGVSSASELRDWALGQKEKGTPLVFLYELENKEIETLDQELQDKLNNLRSFQDSNYVYTIINDKTDIISENLKPQIHTEFLAKDHFKESRTVNNLLIWNRALKDDELLNQNKLFHERFNMKSNTVKGEPINEEINLTQGGYAANTLSLEYTIEI